MIAASTVAYLLCTLVSAMCAALLFRSWKRNASRLIMWVAVAFAFLTASNVLLMIDALTALDFSLWRPLLIAVGLGLLVYGLTMEDQ